MSNIKTAKFPEGLKPSPKGTIRPINHSDVKAPSSVRKTVNFSNVMKMQDDIKNLADAVLSKGQGTLEKIISSQSNTSYDLKSAMNKINTASGFKSDKIWKGKTQNALNDVYRLAASLLNTNNVFKLNAVGYTMQDLLNLRKLISGYTFDKSGSINLSPKDQNLRAKIISTHLMALIGYYNNIIQDLVADPRTKLDDGELVSYKQRDAELSNKELEAIKSKGDYTFSVDVNFDGKTTQVPVPLTALQSPKDFDNWFSTSNVSSFLKPFGDSKTFFNKVVKPQLG